MTIQSCFKELADQSKPLRHSGLLQLSGLTSDEIAEFKTEWSGVGVDRRREILARMIELSEDNLEFDFVYVFRVCLADADAHIREQATRGLWDSDDRVCIRPLIALLHKDPSPRVKAAAAASLSKFAAMARDSKLMARDGERILSALLTVIGNEGEHLDVRRRAIEAVSHFDTPEVGEIIQWAYYDGEPKLRQSAVYAMGRSSNSRWLPFVLRDSQDDDPAIRFEAANAIGQLGDETSVPHLIVLVKDEDDQVQLSAVHALGAIGGVLAKQALNQCMKLGDEAMEEAARTSLRSIEFDEDPLGFRFQ